MGAIGFGLVLAQATKGSAGIGGIPPAILPDVSIGTVLLFAALNPVTIAVAWAMGRRADATAKLPIAGFAASVAGALLLWFGTLMRLGFLATPARAAAGIFVAGIFFATLYAWLAFRSRKSDVR